MGNYSLMGLLGLQDNLSPTMRRARSETTALRREVQGLDRDLKALAQTQRRLGGLAGGGIAGGGTSRGARSLVAAAMLDGNPQQRVARASRVIQAEERRQQRAAEQASRQQARLAEQEAKSQEREAKRLAGVQQRQETARLRQQAREKAVFERQSARFLERQQRAEVRAANQVMVQQARATRMADLDMRRRQREEARANTLAERQRRSTIDSFGKGFGRVAGGFWNTFTTVGRGALSVLTAPIRAATSLPGMLGLGGGGYLAAQAIGGALNFSGMMEQARVAYETMLGSAAKGKAFLADLFGFAAKTPFEFLETQDNARRLLAYGFKTEGAEKWRSVMPWMTSMGNAVSLLGTGTEGFQRLSVAIGQVSAKGRLMGEELRQLTETGIPVVDILAQKLGMAKEEIMKGAEAGISADRALKALMEGLDERYGGGMIRQSRTWLGVITTIKDNVLMTVSGLGDGIRGKLQPHLLGIADWFEQNPKQVEVWRQRLTTLGYKAAKGLADYVGGAMKRVDALFTDPKFQNADLFGKAALLWDAIIGQPFAEWWAGKGKERVSGIAHDMGAFLGGTITGAIKAAFGIQDNSMVGAGVTAGRSFVEGFIGAINEVDWGQVWATAMKRHPVITSAVTLGGANMLTGGLLGAGVGGLAKWGAGKIWGRLFPTAAGGAAAGGAGALARTVAGPEAMAMAKVGARGALGAGAQLGTGALLGTLLGRYVVGPAGSALFRFADEHLPGGRGYTQNRLERERELTETVKNTPATFAPAPQRKEFTLNLNILRADGDDNQSLAEKIQDVFRQVLGEALENS